MIDWKPIETAPKDRRVLLYFPTLPDLARVQGGRWDDCLYAKKLKPHWKADTRWMRSYSPTHWAEINEPVEIGA